MNFYKFYVFILIFFVSCTNSEKKYLNINESISYVGMEKCASCHFEQYDSFIRTGMGQSFRPAIQKYSSSVFNATLYDSSLNLFYYPHWFHDTLLLEEYRLQGIDTLHAVTNKVDYIIGSGHHTNSHLFQNNGYLYQSPFTYYTQDSILDFPPGFENDKNSRFSRKMGLECVACHNAYPDFVLGSENKYNHIPEGIDCERCHGPGEAHLNQIKNGDIIDTSAYIDYSIVNPSHLSVELQNDMCARCHLQGNAVLKDNKSFFDFRPGMYLKNVMDIYLPRYSNSDNEFIMASHVDRMKLSACYVESNESLSCISCHNPHISVKETSKDFFNKKCLDCHYSLDCKEVDFKKNKFHNDCVGCHMKTSETIDIPHVKITDHKIAIHNKNEDNNGASLDNIFLGLECINNNNPSNESLLEAYLQQYERLESYDYYLDSALNYLNKVDFSTKKGLYLYIYYSFLKEDYMSIIHKVKNTGLDSLLKHSFINKEYSNKDAWTCYRIGESFVKNQNFSNAIKFYQQAVKLAPYNLEFRNKYGVALFNADQFMFSIDEFEFIISEDSQFVSAYTNLGYVYFNLGKNKKALSYYNYALKLNPNHEKTLINKAQLLLLDNNKKDAFICVEQVLLINPNNEDARKIINYINEI